MALQEPLVGLTGSWAGTTTLWMMPGEPGHESASMAEVAVAGRGNFLTISYDWNEDGPQDGLIVLSSRPNDSAKNSVWLDSWHTAPGMMPMSGVINDDGTAVMDGTYGAPPDPDWGWRIVIDPTPAPDFHIVMFNITPDGEAFKAVEGIYRRVNPVD